MKKQIFVRSGILLVSEDTVVVESNPNLDSAADYDTARRLVPSNGQTADYPPHLLLLKMDDLVNHDGDDRWWAGLIRTMIGDDLGDPAQVMVCPLVYAGKVGDPRLTWECV